MIKAPTNLQDLRKKIYAQAKANTAHRFWGLYVHVCKLETLEAAYRMAKQNGGAPGIDGVTFEAIEKGGYERFLRQLRGDLVSGTYRPLQNRKVEIPKEDGKTRTLGIPTIRDRVVQGALKLILEPVFEADFQDGSYGYRPKRTQHQAIHRVAKAIIQQKTTVIDMDLKSYFDHVRHDLLLSKVAKRVNDANVMRLLRQMLKASGKRGVPQGGVISPLLANLYLNEVDRMLEKAKKVTCEGPYFHIEYARFADDLIVLVDGKSRWQWLAQAAMRRLLEELAKVDVKVNTEKTRVVDLNRGDDFNFLGFNFRRKKTRSGKWGVLFHPRMKARTRLIRELKRLFTQARHRPIYETVKTINPVIRGWVNYYRIGHSTWCFRYVKQWLERKVRRHIMRAKKLRGVGWQRWDEDFLYGKLGLYRDYQIRYYTG